MKQVITILVETSRPIPVLANMIAGRAYTIDGVTNAEPYALRPLTPDELAGRGFTMAEIALGLQEVHRQ